MKNYYDCNCNCKKNQPKRKIGFWEFALGVVCASAAVKITRTAYKAYEKSLSKKPDEIKPEDFEEDKPIDYLLYRADKLSDAVKARRKVAELLDLYAAFDEKEFFDIMGIDVIDNDLVRKIFTDRTKFAIRFKDKKYCLYAQAPEEVADDEFGNEEEGKTGIPESDVE